MTSAFTWAKEVEDAMVEVTTKVMRLRQRLKGGVTDWEECLEIDVRVQDVELHPDTLTDFILKVKTLFQMAPSALQKLKYALFVGKRARVSI